MASDRWDDGDSETQVQRSMECGRIMIESMLILHYRVCVCDIQAAWLLVDA